MANELMERIKNAANNLVTLEIITVVGDMVLKEGKTSPGIDYAKNPKIILTQINLLQGDITTVYHEEFVTGAYQSLREFHAAREKEGYAMVKANIEALKALLELVKSFTSPS